ncbi:hypothetical protein [Conexivisphaera calida]|uniref:CARDB domain-containing protein n=1 Tax=Conexivisphaera calida TaxID=1874277 RepID=A0A4P2VBY0_9ARCH|nr:hypothetical protein [Conexivisphaera calida]BBE42056.1 hypothetical protein NAS2_0667 [Conexivisphaera calida]
MIHRYPDLYPEPEVTRDRRRGAAHIAREMALVVITILLAAAVWKFVVGYMSWGSSAPAAAIQGADLEGGVLTVTIQNIGAVPIQNVTLVYLNGPLARPVPLITAPLPPGASAGTSVDVANITSRAPPCVIAVLVVYEDNSTQILGATAAS